MQPYGFFIGVLIGCIFMGLAIKYWDKNKKIKAIIIYLMAAPVMIAITIIINIIRG